MRKTIGLVALGCALGVVSLGASPVVAQAAPSGTAALAQAKAPSKKALYKNCTAVNKKYPHGVGRSGAKDKTSGKKVTTFKKSSALYQEAMSYNRGLDRDKDGIACEKR